MDNSSWFVENYFVVSLIAFTFSEFANVSPWYIRNTPLTNYILGSRMVCVMLHRQYYCLGVGCWMLGSGIHGEGGYTIHTNPVRTGLVCMVYPPPHESHSPNIQHPNNTACVMLASGLSLNSTFKCMFTNGIDNFLSFFAMDPEWVVEYALGLHTAEQAEFIHVEYLITYCLYTKLMVDI